MKNIKNLKNILIIIVFALSIIFLIQVIVRANKNSAINSEEFGKLEKFGAGEAMAQVYSSSKVPNFQEGDKIFGSKDAKIKIFVYEDDASLYLSLIHI